MSAHTEDMDRLRRAISLAVFAHKGQVDKAGEPYIWHVMRVGMALLPDVDAAIVGLLHDAVEDNPELVPSLAVKIGILFGPEIQEAVLAITRWPEESYDHYFVRMMMNYLARKAKTQDCLDNSNPERLAKLTSHVQHRLQLKYAKALRDLHLTQATLDPRRKPHEAQSHPRNDSAEPAGDPSNSPESVPEGTGGEAPNRNPSSGSY